MSKTLRDEGYRFVSRNGECRWVHPLEVLDDDIDCTDMNDLEFYAFIVGDEVLQPEQLRLIP